MINISAFTNTGITVWVF